MSSAPAAPLFRDAYQNAQPELLSAPYPSLAPYDQGWWFNYFWTEARHQVGRRTALLSVYKEAFEPVPLPTQANAVQINAGSVKLKPKPATDMQMKSMLERLLLIGFKAMEQTPNYIVDASTIFADQLKLGMRRLAQINNVRFAYRGEKRDVATLCKHAAVDSIATKRKIDALGMNSVAPWHPFSDPYFRNKHYFRLGAVDNCLHSAISITDQLYTATKFPLLNDENIYPMPLRVRQMIERGGVVNESINNQDWWATRKAEVFLAEVVRDGKMALMFWTETTLYIFKLSDTDQVYNTRQRQMDSSGQNFPEQAVSQLPLDSYLAAVKIRRVHHGLDHTAQGHTAFIQDIRVIGDRPLGLAEEGRQVLMRKLGDPGGGAFFTAMTQLLKEGRFVVGKNEKITEVKNWEAKQPEGKRVKI